MADRLVRFGVAVPDSLLSEFDLFIQAMAFRTGLKL